MFTNLLLADEINRTPPKTQAALLEAMEERQVSVDGEPHPLPEPFMVAATQNPVEYEGTYPLPEAQLDRFLLKLGVPLPPRDDEIAGAATGTPHGFDPRDLAAAGVRPVADGRRTSPPASRPCARCGIADEVLGYIVDIVRATRRVAVAVARGLAARCDRAAGDRRAWAWLSGRDFVTPDDVKALAHADAARTGSRCAPRPSSRASASAAVLDSALAVGAGAPLMWRSPAATGRCWPCSGLAPVAVCARAVPCDAARLGAAGARSRSWPSTCLLARLAQAARRASASRRAGAARRDDDEQRCWVTNTGRRGVRGVLRDAWPPSAGAVRCRAPSCACRRGERRAR